jgi:chromosome segregation ATPase
MLENPVIMMALPAALALASMLTGFVLSSWLNSRYTETLQDVNDQLTSIKRAHKMAGGRETAEWQMEIDALKAEISELRSEVEVHESEVALACETIDRLRFKLNSQTQPGQALLQNTTVNRTAA